MRLLHLRLISCAALFLTILADALISAATMTYGEPVRPSRFAEVLTHYERAGFLNGAVLVAQHGHVVYARGVGEADMTSHTANTPQTKFDIGSITKQFTAALVLQQVEAGRIRLDDPLSTYLPWYRSDTGKQIVIEQLLHHTSGLPPDFDTPSFNATPTGATYFEPRAFVEKFCESNLSAAPGSKWQYSNCGYDILGLVLESVTGQPYANLLRQKLLDPAGMHDSGLDRNGLVLSNRALGYERHLGPTYTPGPYLDLTHVYAAGAMYSTAEDLFRWNEAMSSDAVLSESIRKQIFTPGLNNWGYGWFVSRISAGQPGEGSAIAEMRGDMPGNFFCSINRYPEQDVVIIVLRNGYGSTERLESNLQAVLFGQKPRLPWRKPADVLISGVRSLTRTNQPHVVLAVIAGSMGLLFLVLHRRRSATKRIELRRQIV